MDMHVNTPIYTCIYSYTVESWVTLDSEIPHDFYCIVYSFLYF